MRTMSYREPEPPKPQKRDVTDECELRIGPCSKAPQFMSDGWDIAYVTQNGWEITDYARKRGYSISISIRREHDIEVQVPHIFFEGK